MISSTFELNVCHEVSLKFYKGKLRILVRKLSCGTCMYKKLWEKMLFRLQAHIFFSLYSIWQKKALKSFLLSFKGWSLSQTFRIRYLIDLSNLQTDILIYIGRHHVFMCFSFHWGQISAMIFIFMVLKWFDQVHYKKMPGLLYAVSLLWYCRCDLLHEAYTLELHIAIWFL